MGQPSEGLPVLNSAPHIKLPLIKMFVKAMDKEREGFDCLRQQFSENRPRRKQEFWRATNSITI
jgi:hypothetical protein